MFRSAVNLSRTFFFHQKSNADDPNAAPLTGADFEAGAIEICKAMRGTYLEHGRKKANRVSILTRIDGRCKTMGRTGVMPTTTYGSSAVGADEKNIKNQKRKLAIATGKGLSAGTSSTLAIEMTYGS